MFRPSAYRVYLLMEGATALFRSMIYIVLAVYYVQTVHMNPLQLVLVGTVLEVTYFLFQVPTGVLADTWSRRLSIVAGTLLVGVCFVLQGILSLFAAIVLAEVVRGVGEAFIDGAVAAWIADEVAGQDSTGRIYLRGGQAGQVGGLLGTVAGVALASIRLNLPVLIGGALLIGLSAVLLLVMPEQHFAPAPRGERTRRQVAGDALREAVAVVRSQPVVLTILAVGIVFGAFSEGFDRLWEAHFLHDMTFPSLGALKPVVWFGIISVAGMPLSLLASEVVRRRLDMTSHTAVARALLALTALLIVSIVAFGLATNFAIAVGALWAIGLLRGLYPPISTAWLNGNLPSHVRATVLSIAGQADAIGQVAGGPVVGAVGTAFSLRAALVASGLLLSPALALYGRTLRRHRPLRIEGEAEVTAPGA